MADVVSRLLIDRAGWGLGALARRWWNQVGRAFEHRTRAARLEERVRERERIARELHDTLLQGTQALLMSVQGLAHGLRPEDPMHGMLTDALQRADAVMKQGLERIQNLRATTGAAVDLAQSLVNAWRDLGGDGALCVLVEGPTRELEAYAADEILLIAREALNNALRHSKARLIEAQIVFGDEQLRLSVRDDGLGFCRQVLRTGSPSGHWGLQGMRERAERLSAELAIWSAPGAGTEIALTVPAAFAYGPRADGR